MPAPDVIVIGAGIGGLSAAIRLAAAGRRVLVLERNHRVGGKMSEITDAGFRFDTGPSVITMRPVFEELFTSAGRSLQDYLTLLPVEPLTRYFYPDGSRLDISRTLSTTLDQIAALDSRDVEGYLSFLSHAAYLNRITSPVFTYGPPPTPASFLKVHPLDAFRVGLDALQSMDALIRRHVHHPHLRQLLGRFATYVGSSPYMATATLAVIAHVELNEGVWYPQGGIYAIARAYERLARELGVEIRTGAGVEGIRVARSQGRTFRVTGVMLETGEVIASPVVISNMDVATTYESLHNETESHDSSASASVSSSAVGSASIRLSASDSVPEFAFTHRAAHLDRMETSCSGFVMLLGVESQHPELAHHNILFSSDYKREFDQIFHDGQPPDDPTVYIAITSKTDPEHAPPGCENWFVLVNVPAADGRYDWEANRQAYAQHILAQLARRGFDVRNRLKVVRTFTPDDLQRMNGARRGSLYGVSFNDRFAPFKRPGNRAPDVNGLYFVGGTTHPGGGVPMVTLSGKGVANMILEQ